MAVEIERKFIANPSVLALCRAGTPLVQGYLFTDAAITIRIRRAGERALITWKSPRRGAKAESAEGDAEGDADGEDLDNDGDDTAVEDEAA